LLPIIGFQVVSSNYFQAVGKAKIAIFLSLSRQFIFLIPMLIILPPMFGLNGVWIVGPVSDILAALVTMFFLYKDMNQLRDLEETAECK
ncbi:MATE family efflux transporter, partial [Coprococcus sp. MSK.21.13]|nr:MATE family efflux transporter [Bacteroidales bacterium MSK.15.36]NSJ92157.1 MATE family efflux transporter [Coprococcus sp. MSK.21.13]